MGRSSGGFCSQSKSLISHRLNRIIAVLSLFCGIVFPAPFTFFATSDLHFGRTGVPDHGRGDVSVIRASMPDVLNTLPGTQYPNEPGTFVETPKGLLVPGDMVHREETALWDQYKTQYTVDGKGVVHYPVYEGSGNHEVETGTQTIVSLLKQRVRMRDSLNWLTNRDSVNYNYSWDWEGVHFVNLNLFPGTTSPSPNYYYGPANSAAFLRADLAAHVGISGRPIFLMHHYPYNDTTYAPDFDAGWITKARTDLFDLLKGYNVIGILHGHTHRYPSVYTYRGIQIFDDGCNMCGDIFVIRIGNGVLKANNYFRNGWGTVRYEKAISMGKPFPIKPEAGFGPKFRLSILGRGIAFTTDYAVEKTLIYGINGKLILSLKTKDPETVWDGREAGGQPLKRGLYFLQFISKNRVSTAKLVL